MLGNSAKRTGMLHLLSLISSGKADITIGGRPLLAIRSEDKAIEVDIHGMKNAGIQLSDIINLEAGDEKSLPAASLGIAAKLSRLGWRLLLYESGEKVLTMGRGVSRLTGHISANPLKLRKLLAALE
jgi:hypothetical protein